MRRTLISVRTAVVAAVCTLAALLLPAAPAQATTHDPVLFVHGIYTDGPTTWTDMIADFEREGWDPGTLQMMNYNTWQSLEESAAEVVEEVAVLRARTGAAKVDIVTHSMGAPVVRWYLKFLGGTAHVDDFVSVAGANHGGLGVEGCVLQPACQDLAVYSPFMQALNSGDETPGPTTYTAVWSSCDEFINPDLSATLDGARNIWAGCVGHVTMAYWPPNFDRAQNAVA
ncbi:esterase/lipase family protein [Streptomyces sp. MSC1_001]|jgi:triacylglycerol lipase|uniref:esterase/lipase family protein n=1 Tax=Streptomyces sp. MSC1_001 TaxID=2909263 RepID=UPI002030058D|nr:lipase family protein [Streptomyces sp. MSC1_001]